MDYELPNAKLIFFAHWNFLILSHWLRAQESDVRVESWQLI